MCCEGDGCVLHRERRRARVPAFSYRRQEEWHARSVRAAGRSGGPFEDSARSVAQPRFKVITEQHGALEFRGTTRKDLKEEGSAQAGDGLA